MAREKDQNLRGKGKEGIRRQKRTWKGSERNRLTNGKEVEGSCEIPEIGLEIE